MEITESNEIKNLSEVSIPNSRFKTILPEVGGTQQTNHKVKALLVIDNSGTMANSQKNLSDHVSALLERLSVYDSEIQIVSSSYEADDGRPDIKENFLFSTNSSSLPAIVNGYSGTSNISEMVFNSVPTYSINPEQSLEERQAVMLSISNRIKSLGTQGSSSEAPFAVAAMQGAAFFNENDRGLIFIITDEDDSTSIEKLSKPLFSHLESAPTGEFEELISPVSSIVISEQVHLSSGECNLPIFGQDGVIIGYELQQVSTPHSTAQSCQSYVNAQSTCALSCSSQSQTINLTSYFPCSWVALPPTQTLVSCSESTITTQVEKITVGINIEKFPFNVKKDQIYSYAGGAKGFFVNEFKNKVISKLKEKYFISVIANTDTQSCVIPSGQSPDTFFKSIKNQFPIQNMSIDSICNTTGNFKDRLKKIASDFLNILNSKYSVGLTKDEFIKNARIKLVGASDFVDLKLDVDFKIENGQLVLLNSNLFNFQQIELEISTSK